MNFEESIIDYKKEVCILRLGIAMNLKFFFLEKILLVFVCQS